MGIWRGFIHQFLQNFFFIKKRESNYKLMQYYISLSLASLWLWSSFMTSPIAIALEYSLRGCLDMGKCIFKMCQLMCFKNILFILVLTRPWCLYFLLLGRRRDDWLIHGVTDLLQSYVECSLDAGLSIRHWDTPFLGRSPHLASLLTRQGLVQGLR